MFLYPSGSDAHTFLFAAVVWQTGDRCSDGLLPLTDTNPAERSAANCDGATTAAWWTKLIFVKPFWAFQKNTCEILLYDFHKHRAVTKDINSFQVFWSFLPVSSFSLCKSAHLRHNTKGLGILFVYALSKKKTTLKTHLSMWISQLVNKRICFSTEVQLCLFTLS